ncbi:MAG: TusE/DsrC/DsvC family sulfur relay protein [Syntrophales bacterium]
MERHIMRCGRGKEYKLDRHGFLDPPHQWDENFANCMAKKLGIPRGLTEEHWKFIRYLREKFIEEGTVPVVVLACAENGLKLSKLRALFPTGYHRGACKIAGISYAFMYKINIWLTYESYTALKDKYKLDPTGFLENFEEWDEDFTLHIVNEWNLPNGLTDRHRHVIIFLREYYKKTKNIPTIFKTCSANNMSLDELHELFPEGYRRGACRIAGLPFFA